MIGSLWTQDDEDMYNSWLINKLKTEIEELKKQLKIYKHQCKEYEKLLGVKSE